MHPRRTLALLLLLMGSVVGCSTTSEPTTAAAVASTAEPATAATAAKEPEPTTAPTVSSTAAPSTTTTPGSGEAASTPVVVSAECERATEFGLRQSIDIPMSNVFYLATYQTCTRAEWIAQATKLQDPTINGLVPPGESPSQYLDGFCSVNTDLMVCTS